MNGHTNGNGVNGVNRINGQAGSPSYGGDEIHRLPPHNRDAERAILGMVLRDNRSLAELQVLIGPEAFYVFGHQLIFKGMAAIAGLGQEIDYITLGAWLRDRTQLEDAGGHGYLVDLWDAAPGGFGNLKQYAELVRDKAIARELIHACCDLMTRAYEPGTPADELVDIAERAVFELSRLNTSGDVIGQEQAVLAYLEDLDRRGNRDREQTADDPVLTGWPALDRVLIGFHPEELILVAARPAVGKSVMAVNIILHAAGRGEPVLFCCLEQSAREQVFRQMAQRTGVNSWRLRGGLLDILERERVVDAATGLRTLPICYDDRPDQKLARITGNARRLKAKGKLRLLVVDYLQLVDGSAGGRRGENRSEEVGRISRGLKLLARELKIPVVACAQLNRGPTDRRDQKPRLSDLRESGSLEQDSDTVLLLHKAEPDDAERTGDVLDVLIAKNRNGPQGEVSLYHRKAQFSIENYGGECPP